MGNSKPQRSHLKKGIYRGLIAHRAFDQVRMLSRFLLENHVDEQNPLFPSFMTAICVIYARPFTSNTFLGSISSNYGQFSDPELKRAHDAVLTSRNAFYAHTDGSKIVQSPDKQTEEPLHQLLIQVKHQQTPQGLVLMYHIGAGEMNLRAINLPNIIRACEDIQRRLDEDQVKLRKMLFDEQNASGNYLPPGLHRFRLDDES